MSFKVMIKRLEVCLNKNSFKKFIYGGPIIASVGYDYNLSCGPVVTCVQCSCTRGCLQSFGLLDKKSIKVKGINDFAWSPTDDYICYWTPEERDVPARVCVISIPSRETFCQKNLFTVKECRLHWQKKGDYLCVKVDRYKSKKEEKDVVKYSVSCGVAVSLHTTRNTCHCSQLVSRVARDLVRQAITADAL